jgi:hypothetical protein
VEALEVVAQKGREDIALFRLKSPFSFPCEPDGFQQDIVARQLRVMLAKLAGALANERLVLLDQPRFGERIIG